MKFFCMIIWRDIFTLKLDALLEAVIGNLTHIMLNFERGLAHITKHLC